MLELWLITTLFFMRLLTEYQSKRAWQGSRFAIFRYYWDGSASGLWVDQNGVPVLYNCIEDVISDLQDLFDSLKQGPASNEGSPEEICEENELRIRCVNTQTECAITLIRGRVVLVSERGGLLNMSEDLQIINRTGEFPNPCLV